MVPGQAVLRISLYLFYCVIQADFIKKIQARGRQCGEKYKWEKEKGEKKKETNIREINKAAVLLPYLVWGLFELYPEVCIILIFLGLFCRCWVCFYEPSKVLGVVDFVGEELLTAVVEEVMTLIGG